MSRFELGQVVATPGAIAFANEQGINLINYIRRHAKGDDGDLSADDKRANKEALEYGNRIFSSYTINKDKIYIITEHDRSSTTIMMAEDY